MLVRWPGDEAALVECYREISLPIRRRTGRAGSAASCSRSSGSTPANTTGPVSSTSATPDPAALSALLQDLLRAGLTHPEFVL